MSPRVGPIEVPAPRQAQRSHPGHESDGAQLGTPIDPDTETRSDAARVAEFRTSRYHVSMPAMVIVALITAVSGALVAWINKPPPPPVSALTAEQAAALQQCSRVAQDVAEIKAWTRWAEPQIGILLVRTDSQTYTPPPRAP